MKNLFCLGRVWYVWVAISLLLSQVAFAQNITNQSAQILNDSVIQDVQTEINVTSEVSDNSTVSENVTSLPLPETNMTSNETQTIPPDLNETVTTSPMDNTTMLLDVQILYPGKLTRGNIIEIRAVITNTGSIDVNNAVISWLLPKGFEIISKQENCASISQNSSCESLITVKTSFAELGLNSVKVVVNYG